MLTQKKSSVRYTMAHRNCETKSVAHLQERNRMTPVLMQRMNNCLIPTRFRTPIDCIHRSMPGALMDDATACFQRTLSKTTLGTAYKRGDVTDFVRRINSLKKDDDAQLCIGIWLMGCGGRKARWHQQGPSTMHWQWAPEETIQTLSCHYHPGVQYVQNVLVVWVSMRSMRRGRRPASSKKVVSAQNEAEILKAMRFSVRGLRHCHNASCAAHLNRDHNAAVNIQRRCKQWLFSTAREDDNMTIEEEVMESLRVLIGHGE